MGSSAPHHELLELTPDRLSDIAQRSQRTRGQQRLTHPPQHPHRATPRLAERAQQRRLAHPSLTRHQYQPPLSARTNPSKRFLQHQQTISTLEKYAQTHPRTGTRGLTRRLRQPLDHSATSFARASSTDRHELPAPNPLALTLVTSELAHRRAETRPRPLRLAERTPSRPASRLPDRTSSHSVGSAACFSKLPMHGCGMTTSRTSSSPTGPSSRNRVEAHAQPHPPAPRSPPRAALSLARERFAEKQASGSRPCPVARRSRYRPNPSVRPAPDDRFHMLGTRRSALAIGLPRTQLSRRARRTAASPG